MIYSRVFGRYNYRQLHYGLLRSKIPAYDKSDFDLTRSLKRLRWKESSVAEVLGSKGSQLPLAYRDLVASGFSAGGLLDEEGKSRSLMYKLERGLLPGLETTAKSHLLKQLQREGGYRDDWVSPTSYKQWVEIVWRINNLRQVGSASSRDGKGLTSLVGLAELSDRFLAQRNWPRDFHNVGLNCLRFSREFPRLSDSVGKPLEVSLKKSAQGRKGGVGPLRVPIFLRSFREAIKDAQVVAACIRAEEELIGYGELDADEQSVIILDSELKRARIEFACVVNKSLTGSESSQKRKRKQGRDLDLSFYRPFFMPSGDSIVFAKLVRVSRREFMALERNIS